VETGAELDGGVLGNGLGDIKDEAETVISGVKGEEGDTVGSLGDVTLTSESGNRNNGDTLGGHGVVISTLVLTTRLIDVDRDTGGGETALLARVLTGEGHKDEGDWLVGISDTRSLTKTAHGHGTAGQGGRWTVLESLWHDLDTWHRLIDALELEGTDILHVNIAVLVETVREGTLELLDTLGGGDHDTTIIDGLEESGARVDDVTIVGNAVGDTVEELVTETDINTHADTETGVVTSLLVFLGTGRVIVKLLWPLGVEEVNGGDKRELDSVETVVEGDGERVTLIHNLETVMTDGVVAENLLVNSNRDLHDVGIPLPEGGGTLDVSDNDGHVTLRRLSLRGELWVGGTTIENDITGKLNVKRDTDERLGVGLHAREDGGHDTGGPQHDDHATEKLVTELLATLVEGISVEEADAGALLVGEETDSDTAPDTAGTVDRRGVERIVNLVLKEEAGGQGVDTATHDTGADGTEWVKNGGTGGDGDTASKHAVHESLEVNEARLDEDDTESRETTSRGTDGSDGTDATSETRGATGGTEDGATIETEPTEHEEETTGAGEHKIVRLEKVDLTVLRETTVTRTDNGSENEGDDTTSKVDNARASEVEKVETVSGTFRGLEGAAIKEPCVTGPSPVDNTWVDERGEAHGGDEVTLERATLSTGTGDDSTGSRGERPLEEPHCP